MLQHLAPYVPATVVGAIVLFIIKEILEYRRRRAVDARKVKAVRHFVARDLELNYWAIQTYKQVLNAFERVEEEPGRQIRIFTEPSGRLRYEHWYEDDDDTSFRSGGMIAPVVTDFADRFMLDVATLDKELFEKLERTVDDLANLEHIKASLLDQAATPVHRSGFISYAWEELHEIEDSVRGLYEACTDNSDIGIRIR